MEAATEKQALGRLTSFGLQHPWQVAFLLPDSWDDLRQVRTVFTGVQEGFRYVVRGKVTRAPQVRFDKTPRLISSITDEQGNVLRIIAFGDTRDLQERLKVDQKVTLAGTAKQLDNGWWLQSIELVDEVWIGRVRPRYPGKTNVIGPDLVRSRVQQLLPEAIPKAVEWLKQELQAFGKEADLCALAGCPDWLLEDMLWYAHLPLDETWGRQAQQGLERLAAAAAVRAIWDNRPSKPRARVLGIDPAAVERRIGQVSFPLTDEDQRPAVLGIVAALRDAIPLRGLLSGDVGTGKTVVYGLAAAAVVDAGGRVAVLLPTEPLVNQVAARLRTWWPDIALHVVAGDMSAPAGEPDKQAPAIFIGTTALLYRDLGAFDLVVIDEQQRFSREQREQLARMGDAHLLEVSATCIPRSMALAKYGALKVWKLTKAHVEKKIVTSIWLREHRNDLFEDIKISLGWGHQVLVIYPEVGAGGEDSRKSVEGAVSMWQKLFPGRVRHVHSKVSGADKQAAIDAIAKGEADILVATTVVEVGIDLPNLRRVVVVHAERLGLVTLHQLRGRVARQGGMGYCDLYLPEDVSEDALRRLDVLVRYTDGHQVAEEDLRLRGCGDLRPDSNKQSGSDDTVLFGRPLRIESLDSVAGVLLATTSV